MGKSKAEMKRIHRRNERKKKEKIKKAIDDARKGRK